MQIAKNASDSQFWSILLYFGGILIDNAITTKITKDTRINEDVIKQENKNWSDNDL